MSKTTENEPKTRSPRKPLTNHKQRQRRKEACLLSLETQIQQYPPKDQQELELINQRLAVCTHSRCSETRCQCPTSQKCSNHIEHDTRAEQDPSCSAYECANFNFCDTPGNCKPTFLQSLDDTKRKEYDISVSERTIMITDLLYSKEQVYICPTRLRDCRIASGLTFSQIETLSWVTRGWLNRCEKFQSTGHHQKVKIEKALCYFLAALYDTTPGYLMGHTNSVHSDLFTVTYKHRTKGEGGYIHEKPTIKELSLCVYSFSKERANGFKAIEELKKILSKHPDTPETSALSAFLSNGEVIYFKSFPKEIQSELNTFLTGLLHATPSDSSK